MYYFSEFLKEKLQRILNYPLTLIQASSGCGKSTSVNGFFLEQTARDYRQLCYTCLDEPPEDTWKGICMEFEKIDAQVGQYLHSLLVPSEENLSRITTQMRYLSCDKPTVLCIDNYQLFHISCKNRLVEAFTLHTCKNLHIVIITQPYRNGKSHYSSPFPFHFISAENLYFTKSDISAYFKQEGVVLGGDDLDRVWNMTGGYVAAIYLQLESWKYHGNFQVSSRIPTLMEQVLWRHLEPTEKLCLLCLSTVDAFTLRLGAEICGNILTLDEFQEFLEKTDFIKFNLGNRQYYFHHLLLEFVQGKFHDLSDNARKEIWQQSARTWKNNHKPLLAAKLYWKCDDFSSLVSLPFAKGDCVELVHMENGEIITQLIQPSRKHLLLKCPELTLSLALELFVQGKIMLHMQYMEMVKTILENLMDYQEPRRACLQGEYYLLESFLHFNDIQKMCTCHRQAWSHMKRPTQLYSLNIAWTFGIPSVVCMFWRQTGCLEQELRELQEGMPLYYKLANGNGTGAHHAMRGEILLLQGDDKPAENSYRKALYDAEKMGQDSICYCAYLGMARIAILRGNVATYTHMLENIDDKPYLGKETACILTTDLCKGFLALLLGHFDAAPQWLLHPEEIENRTLMLTRPFVHCIYCRLLLERLKKRAVSYEKFREEIHRWVEECRRLHMLLPEVYDWIYLAVGAEMQGQQGEASDILHRALEMCFEDKLLFPFAENYHLLKRLLTGMVLPASMQSMKREIIKLGEKFSKGQKTILSSIRVTDNVLTPRELEIARLLKERLSVKEIAAKLYISPSTVSNIMQSIYSKLDIHSKRELYYREDI